MRSPVALAVTGLVVCLLAGCAPDDPLVVPTDPATPLAVLPAQPLTDPRVLAYCPDIPAVHFTGFTAPEVVYICRADEHRATDGTSTYGPWQAVYRVTDPRKLLVAYARPNANEVDTECPIGTLDPLIVWVHAAGTIRAIYAPVNGCGFARGEMVDAYQKADRELVLEVDGGAPLDAHDTPAEH